ncbi:ABC transporter permease [Nonomuraea typhae]|uniref:ABC transporter permease n=1 Tax=Nonomuraea typhae TaxID=2603600 RepID=A0ABW7YMC7_9ACTN
MTFAATYKLGARLFWRDKAMLAASVITPAGLAVGMPVLMRHVQADGVAAATEIFHGSAAIILSLTAFMNIAVSLSTRRDQLILKRLRATRLTDGQILAGEIASTVTQAVVVLLACLAAVMALAEVPFPAHPVAFFGAVIGGAVTMALLGAAYTALIPRSELAAAMVMPFFLVCAVGAGGMGPLLQYLPGWLQNVFGLLPTSAAVHAMCTGELALPALNLAVWALAALVAIRLRFRWEPRRS